MKIKKSVRGGLTFSFNANEAFKVGTRYRYLVDNRKSEIILIPDEDGRYRMSKKGVHEKPLVDLRNEEIRQAMTSARYMEIEILDSKIVVHVIRYTTEIDTLDGATLQEILDSPDEVTFTIDKETLQQDHAALSEMLAAAGLYSAKMQDDLVYVFDTVSLFSGAGLLDYPFKKDRSFDIRFAVDFDKSACETYRENIGDHIACMDIRDLDAADVPDCDLVIGGPCCQGYSNSNRAGNDEQDQKKRLLIDDYLRITKAKHPLMFGIENVRQFLTKEEGRYLERVFAEMSGNYNIACSVVRDLDVGGYSKRERAVVIGSQKCMGKITIPDVELMRHRTAGDALRKVTPDWFNYHDITKASAATQAKMAQVRPGHNYKDIAEMKHLDRHSDTYRRLAENEPSPTIVNWRKVNMMPPIGNRILSVSEAAAIMGLDRKFRIFGSLNDKQQQIGNGVTQAIASFIKSIIKNALYRYVNRLVIA